jgi:hypothetical protein
MPGGMMESLQRLAQGINDKKLEAQRYIEQKTGGGYAHAQREASFVDWWTEHQRKADMAALQMMRKLYGDSVTSKAVQINGAISKPPPEEPAPQEKVIELDEREEPERTPISDRRGMQGSK